jgi:hypothetical protein
MSNEIDLNENPYSDMDVRHIRLISGAELVSLIGDMKDHLPEGTELDSSDESLLCLENPLQVHTAITPKGQSFYFTRWLPLAKHDVCLISVMNILTIVECSDSIKEKYIDASLSYQSDSSDESIDIESPIPSSTITVH